MEEKIKERMEKKDIKGKGITKGEGKEEMRGREGMEGIWEGEEKYEEKGEWEGGKDTATTQLTGEKLCHGQH